MITTSEINKKLLKKWRWILTRYSKLRDNWWMKITIKWNTTIRLDCNNTKSYYLQMIEQAKKIIERCSD